MPCRVAGIWGSSGRAVFADRSDAGRRLGVRLREALADGPRPIVLGLPRGGVPVAAEVAAELGVELDVLVVRKLGYPGHPEVAYGAIGPDGVVVTAGETDAVPEADLRRIRDHELAELTRREGLYRAGRPPLELAGRRALLVDDGVATGATALAAVRAARALGAAEVIVAAPVGAPDAVARLVEAADSVVVLEAPESFWSVGEWYRDFRQTGDAEVVEALG